MRILIADDNRDSVESLSMLCEAWGFEPICAYDGRAALDILQRPNAPMLCLLDWEMPGVTGIDVCAEIRRELDQPYRYLILITGRDDHTALVTGLDAGADEFLLKPIDPNELRVRLMTGRRVLSLQAQLLESVAQLRDQAARDGLTKLWNRTAIFGILNGELSRCSREGQTCSVALVDIDHFKCVNDSLGHLVGDSVLQQVASRLTGCLRSYDAVGRYGGEEFLIVLPNSNEEESTRLAERLRRSLHDEPVSVPHDKLRVTASIGISTSSDERDSIELLRMADEALYAAKNGGRNRVVRAASPCVPVSAHAKELNVVADRRGECHEAIETRHETSLLQGPCDNGRIPSRSDGFIPR